MSTAGSREAGRDGAPAGIVMKARPRVLETKDFTRLEPGVVEHKFYARGFCSVLERAGNGQELWLVRRTRL